MGWGRTHKIHGRTQTCCILNQIPDRAFGLSGSAAVFHIIVYLKTFNWRWQRSNLGPGFHYFSESLTIFSSSITPPPPRPNPRITHDSPLEWKMGYLGLSVWNDHLPDSQPLIQQLTQSRLASSVAIPQFLRSWCLRPFQRVIPGIGPRASACALPLSQGPFQQYHWQVVHSENDLENCNEFFSA